MPQQRGATWAFGGEAVGALVGIPLRLAYMNIAQQAAAIDVCQVHLGRGAWGRGTYPQLDFDLRMSRITRRWWAKRRECEDDVKSPAVLAAGLWVRRV